MKKKYLVEIKNPKREELFDDRQLAEDYAITQTVWVGGSYRITPIYVAS